MSTLIQGDCRDVLAGLPEQSVHMVVTSPPYWGLRSYQAVAPTVWGGEIGHEHEWTQTEGRGMSGGIATGIVGSHQDDRTHFSSSSGLCPCGAWRGVLGSEPTPEQYVANMVTVFRAVKRVLRDDGTLWLNLGPTWAGSGGAGGDYGPGGLRAGQPEWKQGSRQAPRNEQLPRADLRNWPAKCMVPIPWMVGLALIQDGWILRSEIIWDKPAPMPESVTDRPTKSHEQILLLTKRQSYYYDAEAVREPLESPIHAPGNLAEANSGHLRNDFGTEAMTRPWGTPAGRNARSVWRIAPEPSPEKHYAMYPSGLPRRCILAGTSERGCCPECGAQW